MGAKDKAMIISKGELERLKGVEKRVASCRQDVLDLLWIIKLIRLENDVHWHFVWGEFAGDMMAKYNIVVDQLREEFVGNKLGRHDSELMVHRRFDKWIK